MLLEQISILFRTPKKTAKSKKLAKKAQSVSNDENCGKTNRNGLPLISASKEKKVEKAANMPPRQSRVKMHDKPLEIDRILQEKSRFV
jgi:hypothetical protein